MPKHYTIEILGHLDDKWSELLYGMDISHRLRNAPISTLRGEMDQAALLGVLYQLHSLNIAILTVHCAAMTQQGGGTE